MVWVVGAIGPFWVRRARGVYRRRSRGLTEGEREAVAGWFDAALLDRVRVAIVDEVMLPAPRLRRLADVLGAGGIVVDRPSGIALVDVVAVSAEAASSGVEGVEVPASLLFHELVHIAQWEVRGVRGFVRAYATGWVVSGKNYYGIPLEREAFELQRRFEEGERFRVGDELAGE